MLDVRDTYKKLWGSEQNMNERCKQIKIEDLILEMQYLSNIYDIVRIVDPANATVLRLVDGKLQEEKQAFCFSVWKKEERCENCTSSQACAEKRRLTKFEFIKDRAYYILSVPYCVQDGQRERIVALELVNQVTSDFQLQDDGTNQTTDLVRAITMQNYEDTLTGTFNRRYFDERRYLYDSIESVPRRIGFLMIDVNQFKSVNDLYGHMHGDELLACIGETLQKSFRSTDKVIRVGGDEFVVIAKNCNQPFLEDKCITIKGMISEIHFEWMGERRPSVAIGMAYTDQFVGKKEQIDELYKKADEAMYHDKMKPLPETSQKSILIVDDMQMNRDFIKVGLEDKFHVIEAENGEDALVILKTNHVDLIITDIFMNRMDGYEFMRNVRDSPNMKNIPIIAVTENELGSQSKAIASGANIFIDRPTREELLVKSIMQLTGHDHGRRELFNMDFVLDSIPGAVLVCKFQEEVPDILYCSRGIHNIADVESSEFGAFFAKKGTDMIFSSDVSKFTECIQKIIKTHSRGEIVFRSYKKSGELVWLWMQARYVGEEDGCPILEEIILDVSNNTNMYESLLDEASSLITVIDCESREVLYANRKTIEVLKDVSGKKCHAIFFHRDSPCQKCAIDAADCELDEKNWIHNGRVYRQIMKKMVWNGRHALLKCMEDITEQKELQKYAESEKDTLNHIIQNVPAGLFVFKMDKDGQIKIVEANPSACAIMGIDFAKTIGAGGNEVFELTHPDDRGIIADVINKLRMPGAVVPYEYRQFNKEKKAYCWMSAMAHSVLEKDGSLNIYISYFDITEQKKAQRLREDLRIAKIESQEKTDFMSNMSHDMRTPLNGMLGLSYLMTEKTDLDELHDDARQLIVSGKLLLNLINDTLDISKIESGKFKLNLKPINSGLIFQNIVTIVNIYAEQAGVILEYDVPTIPKNQWISVVADSSRIEQVLINIITNAIKYSHDGGVVELHMKTLSISADTVTDQYTIVDHGIGMSEEFLPHVYEPFVQEGRWHTERAQGSGLGMSIVKQLVDLMGGDISIESRKDVGTTVTLVMHYQIYKGKNKKNGACSYQWYARARM